MAKILIKNAIERKPGFLYYISGNGDVMETPMARGGRRKKSTKKPVKKVAKKTVKKVTKKPVKKVAKKVKK